VKSIAALLVALANVLASLAANTLVITILATYACRRLGGTHLIRRDSGASAVDDHRVHTAGQKRRAENDNDRHGKK